MKTLILSCNTGEGHNSCARAIKEYFDSKKEECVIADGLGFISNTTSDVMSRGHSYIYKHLPWLSRHGYNYAESHTAYYGENTPLYKYFTQGGEKLYRYISLGGFDCVICTHVFTAFMLTRMLDDHPMKLATCFVATDYSSYPAIEKSDLDFYFIPDESLTPVYAEHGIPREKLSVSGIPVRKMFYEKRPAAEAKSAVGIDPTHKHLLIMCGSMGCGPMKRVLRGLSQKSGEKIDIIEYSENPEEYVAAALAPADVLQVEIDEEKENACHVTVPDTQLSLAIGNKGQNARLAARLTGWKIDIKPESGFFEIQE